MTSRLTALRTTVLAQTANFQSLIGTAQKIEAQSFVQSANAEEYNNKIRAYLNRVHQQSAQRQNAQNAQIAARQQQMGNGAQQMSPQQFLSLIHI